MPQSASQGEIPLFGILLKLEHSNLFPAMAPYLLELGWKYTISCGGILWRTSGFHHGVTVVHGRPHHYLQTAERGDRGPVRPGQRPGRFEIARRGHPEER